MHSPERRGAHTGAHKMADWDLVRIFLEVARIGSFRAAAERLNMSANFLSKRISALENAYKATLMTRHVDGIRLTPEGIKVLEAAKRMEEASFGHGPRAEPGHTRAERRGPASPSPRGSAHSGWRQGWWNSSGPIPAFWWI